MLSFFPRGVLDEILNLIESVSESFPSYSYILAAPLRLNHRSESILLDGQMDGTLNEKNIS